MSNKNTLSISAIGVVAVFAIASFMGFGINSIGAQTVAQPEKFVFVEKISTTALFQFRDGTELVPIQNFAQTGGFGQATLSSSIKTKNQESSETTGRSKPSFTMEKILGGTPYLYTAADQAQLYALNAGFEYPYKFFDVTVFFGVDGTILRSFEYKDCQITNYVVNTRADNEEGYTGKGFAIVDQFAFECKGYTPKNPAMENMVHVSPAKTLSSSDIKPTDQWDQKFKAP